MIECSGIAGMWNSHRTKPSDRVWTFVDFHPAHLSEATKPKGMTGREVLQDTTCWFGVDGIEWAEGYGPEKF